MSDFAERFKNHSNSHLLKIAESKGEYQHEAVETAKSILESRRLTKQEMDAAKAEIVNERLKKDQAKQKKIHIQNQVKEFGASVADNLNPVQDTPPAEKRIIIAITIIFSLIFFYQLPEGYEFIKFMLNDLSAKWDYTVVVSLLPLIWLPAGTILFYKRKKAGWALLTIYSSYSLATVVAVLIMDYSRPSIPALDNLFPSISLATVATVILFFGGILWVMCKKTTREIFQIEQKTMYSIITVSFLTTLLFFYSI